MACGYELTAAVAFPSLAYFQLLRFPLVMLPSTIENCVNGLIALRRLQAFLEVGPVDESSDSKACCAPGFFLQCLGSFFHKVATPQSLR